MVRLILLPANHRVQPPLPGGSGQITGVLLKGLRPALLPPPHRLLGRSWRRRQPLDQCGLEPPQVHTGTPQHLDGHVVPLPEKSQKQVLCPHIAGSAAQGLPGGVLDSPSGPGGQPLGGGGPRRPQPHADNHRLSGPPLIQSLLIEAAAGHPRLLAQEA